MRYLRRRALDRVLVGSARARHVPGMVEALRDDGRLRAAYDRGALAMRTLERADVAAVEIDWVERRLEADGILAPVAAAPSRWWWIGAAALATAAALVLALRPPAAPVEPDDPLQARGVADPQAGWFGLSVLCDDGRGAGAAMAEASGGTCPLRGTLGFSVRVDGRHRGGMHLVVFGVDAQAQVQYYLPTPDEAAPVLVRRDEWIALDRAVRLQVNHGPGPLRVYAALLPHAPTLAAIDDAAAVLADTSSQPGEPGPWLDRLGPTHPLRLDCAPTRCLAAELDLRIEANTP